MIYSNSFFRRVVVTGIGAVSPIGKSKNELWESLLAGKTGIQKLDDTCFVTTPCQYAGYVKTCHEFFSCLANADTWRDFISSRKMPMGLTDDILWDCHEISINSGSGVSG